MRKLYLVLLLSSSVFAKNSYYFEIDPFAYMYDGYSVHVGKQTGPLRLDLGVFAMDIPEFAEEYMYDSEDFDIKFKGLGIKLDYFIEKNIFIGLDSNVQKREYIHHTTNSKVEKTVAFVGVRTGFNYELNKNLYFSPWFGVSKNITGNEKITVSTSSVETGEYDYFLTAHIGYKF